MTQESTPANSPATALLPSSLRLFTSAEVAEILRLHPQVVARKLQAGEIPGYKLGKDWRVSEAQLGQYLERHANRNDFTPKNAPPEEAKKAAKVLRTFIVDGKLKAIPTTRAKRLPVLRYLVSKLDPHRIYPEAELNRFLETFHSDVCTLRREFIMNGLMVRKNGKYKVVAARPDRNTS
jgi:excisionase family DNA binding protein